MSNDGADGGRFPVHESEHIRKYHVSSISMKCAPLPFGEITFIIIETKIILIHKEV